MTINPYKELGVSHDATPEQIKKAYRNMSKKVHPDTEGGSEEAFSALHQSYLVLKDPEQREYYDRTGEFKMGDTQSKAAHILASFINEMIEQEIPMFVDYVKVLKEFIRKNADALELKIEDAEKKIKKLEKMRRKLKRKKKGVGLLESVVDGKAMQLRNDVADGKKKLADFHLAITSVDEYEFEKDEKPEDYEAPPKNPFNFFKFGGAS